MSWIADPRVQVYLNELFTQRRMAVTLFVLTNVVFLVAAFMWPKGYVADTTIVVAERNVIQPLMQGAASATDVTDRARVARELINGRQVMNKVVEIAGWVDPSSDERQRKSVIDALNNRTSISNAARNLIKIEYRDSEPERAQRTVKAIGDTFIQESANAKAAESQSAFDFIDKQTQEYHQKLLDMEDKLKEFRITNADVRLGGEGDVNQRMSALQQRIETSRQELREADVRKKSLERQLSGEAEVATTISREGQYRQRIAELTNQLETLRLSYHESYPDIVQLRHQIEDLKRAIEQDRQRRDTARAAGQITMDDSVINNPMYQQLKRDLSQTQITVDTLNARIGEANHQLKQLLETGKKIHGGEATLAELSRDYQVTRDIYQDLLRRRENARVSMNMDKENQGLTFKIQEPAVLPTQPTGLRFWQFLFLGLSMGLLIPGGIVYAVTQFDPRVRQYGVLLERNSLPVMAAVPHFWRPGEVERVAVDMENILLAGLAVMAMLGIGVLVRLTGLA